MDSDSSRTNYPLTKNADSVIDDPKTVDPNSADAVDASVGQRSLLDISDLEAEVRRKGIVLAHDRQHFNWDCGIACARMILKYFNENQTGTELFSYLASMNLKTSIWTIDLAYLLTHFRIPNRMSTLTLGVDANYSNIHFYSSHLGEDDRRVDALFREAHLRDVVVVKEAVAMETIVEHLERRLPILILIDWKKMCCLHCGGSGVFQSWNSDVVGEEVEKDDRGKNVGYQGHFIVLTGVDRENNLIYFSNPSAKFPVCVTPIKALERARKSYGTDEDIIFVYDRQNGGSDVAKSELPEPI